MLIIAVLRTKQKQLEAQILVGYCTQRSQAHVDHDDTVLPLHLASTLISHLPRY